MADNIKLTDPSDAQIDDTALFEDFRAADKLGPFWVGQRAFFYRDGLKKRCIPFADIDGAFMRVEPVPTHCCCCSMNFQIYRLVVCSHGRELADIRTEDEGLVDKTLAFLKDRIPEMKLGYTKQSH
ncbi:MAG TPA: DUF6709 family protein [Candidatus Acidoferrum sp.]|nr:DUF6709 family protein [Candidatus Acidoferrum sp.]